MTNVGEERPVNSQAASTMLIDGRNFKVFHVANTALYKIGSEHGGEMPEPLKGMYTSPSLAWERLEKFMAETAQTKRETEERLRKEREAVEAAINKAAAPEETENVPAKSEEVSTSVTKKQKTATVSK